MDIKDDNGRVIGEVINKTITKATHYKTSNKFTINYLISLGFMFEEEILENVYNGKTSYIFAFPVNQEGFAEAMNTVKECRAEGKHLPFPLVDGKQLSFKTANKHRWIAVEICFPELRR